jgi:type IV pilus assembly protein PilN
VIRINLLGVEKPQKGRKFPVFDVAQRTTLACSLVLVVAGGGIGWWYWSLSQTASRLETEIQAAQREAARLQSLLNEVQTFEDRKGQLQQRVELIEKLRSGQSIPVQLLDHVSRSVPELLWLTSMQQENDAVTIEGQSSTLVALSDFVGNLGSTKLLQKPVEIVDSQVESAQAGGASGARGASQPAGDLIKFKVKAQIASAAKPAEAPAEKKPARKGKAS